MPSLEQIAILEQVLDERKHKQDRRKRSIELPPEIERRAGGDCGNAKAERTKF